MKIIFALVVACLTTIAGIALTTFLNAQLAALDVPTMPETMQAYMAGWWAASAYFAVKQWRNSRQ